jgi:hypothetical protein
MLLRSRRTAGRRRLPLLSVSGTCIGDNPWPPCSLI